MCRSPYKPSVGIKSFLMIQAEDYDEYDIASHFAETAAFLDRARTTGGKALVHCSLGVNRSGAIVAAYLMISERRTLLQVIADLKGKRSLIIANVGFRRQLVRYARCRGLLDAVDRKTNPPPLSRSLVFNEQKNGVVTSNGEAKKISQDSGSNEVSLWKTSTVVRSNDSSDASLAPCYRLPIDATRHGRYTSANIASLVSTARRERLLNDVDAFIEKMSHDDNDEESDGNVSGEDTAEVYSRTSTSRRPINGYHCGEANGGDRYRSMLETETSPISTINLVGSSLSSGRLTATPRGRFDLTSSYNCSTLTPKSKNCASILDTRPGPTNIDDITRVDGYVKIGVPRTTRPTSAHSRTAVGSRRCYDYDVTSKPTADRYYVVSRTGYRRSDEADDVASFLEEAERRAQLSSISAAIKKCAVSSSTATRPRNTRINSSSRTITSTCLIDQSPYDSDDDLTSCANERLACGRIVPTRVTPAPAAFISSRFGANFINDYL